MRLSRLTLLTKEERRQLLVRWNDTARVYPRYRWVHELFVEQSATEPEAVALVRGGERLTGAELDGRANWLARRQRS